MTGWGASGNMEAGFPDQSGFDLPRPPNYPRINSKYSQNCDDKTLNRGTSDALGCSGCLSSKDSLCLCPDPWAPGREKLPVLVDFEKGLTKAWIVTDSQFQVDSKQVGSVIEAA